ncbi:hypothetical protein SEUCBS139899_009696 [Sporothrix eucalyptigena]|uniref:DUF7136 domain-containing protein n=1 Tax=Sporothrix eucalyptigena TaxID=1812306 RepID=A0ABP0CFG0_9PEZI
MSTRIFSEGNRTNNGTIELGILYLDNPLLDSYDASLNSVTYSGDNVYVYFAALNMIGREGAFYLRYSIDLWTGMPETKPYLGEYYSGFEPVSSLSYGSIGFTLKNGSGASLTDLVAGTANTSCADVPLSWPLTITKLVNQTCSETVPIFTKPGETCVFLSNDTQGVVADYDGPYPFVNMTTTGYGCAPTMDKAAAAAVESTMAVQACFAAGNTTTCITNSTGVPNNGFTTVSVPGVAAMMTIVMGIVTGALLI